MTKARTAARLPVGQPRPRALKSLEDLTPVHIRSADDVVYETLRHEIVHGLEPETALRLRDLAARFSVSTMPVRVALQRLQAEGLVVQEPRRGAIVAPLRLSDLADIQTVRAGLEGIAAREGASHLNSADLTRMRDLFEQIQRPGAAALDQYLVLIRELHDVVYRATGHDKLLRLIDSYRRSAERYLRLALHDQADLINDRKRQRAFMEACEAADGAAAEAAVRSLLSWTVTKLAPLIAHET